MRRSMKVLALFGMIAVMPVLAMAQSKCGPRDSLVQRLTEDHGHTCQLSATGNSGARVELYASKAAGTWAIIVTSPLGVSCLMAAGRAFDGVVEVLPPKEIPL